MRCHFRVVLGKACAPLQGAQSHMEQGVDIVYVYLEALRHVGGTFTSGHDPLCITWGRGTSGGRLPPALLGGMLAPWIPPPFGGPHR